MTEPDEYDYDFKNEAAKPLPSEKGKIDLNDLLKYDLPSFDLIKEQYAQEMSIGYLNWYINSDYTIRVDGNFQWGDEVFTPEELFLKYKNRDQ